MSNPNSIVSSHSDTKFLNYGNIEIRGVDKNKRKVVLGITIPFILLNTITPVMLGCGKLSDLKLSSDLSIWQPEFDINEFKQEVSSQYINIHLKAWKDVEEKVSALLRTFVDVASILKDVRDLINILPIGVYVDITAVCDIDKIPNSLEELQKSSDIKGVLEFQFAFAAALNAALNLID